MLAPLWLSLLGTSTRASPSPRSTNRWYTPSMNATFVYDLDNVPVAAPVITTSSGLQVDEQVYIVDMEGHTAEQIANYHAQGKKVICYISAGSWEPVRSDALAFNASCYCGSEVSFDSTTGRCQGSNANQNKLDGWDEWWLDIHSPGCIADIESVMMKRMQAAQAKGCDGVDPDNVDSFTNKQTFGTTAQDEFNYLSWLSETAHSLNLTVDLKNTGDLVVDRNGNPTQWQAALVAAFDFNVIESCHQYDECDKYDAFLAAGKPQIQVEYSYSLKTCPDDLASGQRLTVYSGEVLDSKEITLECQSSNATSTTATNSTSETAGTAAEATSSAASGGRRRIGRPLGSFFARF